MRAILPLTMLLIAGLFAACTGSSPSPAPTPTAPTPPPATATVVSLSVTGTPPAIAATAQFKATAALSNGSAQDVSAQATWQSTNTSVVTVNTNGLVTAIAIGEADITAVYGVVSGKAHIAIARTTYTLSGSVTDDTSHGILPNIRLQVVDGADAGKSTLTDGNGNYTIVGIAPGTFTVSASATSYQTTMKTVALDTDLHVDFVLPRTPSPSPPPPSPPPQAPCNYTIGGTDGYFGYDGGELSVIITRTSGSCSWQATSDGLAKLTNASGNGSGTLLGTVPRNPNYSSRSGTITIAWTGGSAQVTIVQVSQPDCQPGITVNGQSSISVPASGGQYTATVWGNPSVCGPFTASAYPPITITHSDLFSLTFLVAANSSANARTMTVTISMPYGGPASLTVNQAGAP